MKTEAPAANNRYPKGPPAVPPTRALHPKGPGSCGFRDLFLDRGAMPQVPASEQKGGGPKGGGEKHRKTEEREQRKSRGAAPGDGETERRRGRETERQRDGEAERQRDGEAERRRGRETERQRDGEAERRRGRETERTNKRQQKRERPAAEVHGGPAGNFFRPAIRPFSPCDVL